MHSYFNTPRIDYFIVFRFFVFYYESVEKSKRIRVHVPFISKDVVAFVRLRVDMRDHGQVMSLTSI